MFLDIYNNKTSFISLKPRKFLGLIILITIILSYIIYLLITTKVYDNYQTKGYITCNETCVLITYIPPEINYNKIYFNNKLYTYEILDNEIILDKETITSYRKLTLKVSKTFLNNEIVNLNFYYHKQRIITKIKEKMF